MRKRFDAIYKVGSTTLLAVAACMLLSIACAGCDDDTVKPKADETIQRQQEALQQQAVAQTGLPGITNFTELKMVRHLYELRDAAITTYTYIPDMQGRLWHLCDSIGYGIPYATQFSSPEKNVWTDGGGTHSWVNTNLPQSEPNGLFMPSEAAGTWVMCGTKGGTEPVYIEPNVIVSPFKLHAVGEYAEGQ